MKKQIASISGGLTSHYMIDVLIKKFGKENVDFIYCDTGAEHDGTYKFIKQTASFYDINITCIRLHMPKEVGKGGRYVVVPLIDIKKDYIAFRELMEKYGRPFNPGGKFCTDQMKTQIYRKYCNDTYGKDNYVTWIGYRDEPKDSSRSWGHTLSGTITKWFATPMRDQGELYKGCVSALDKSKGELLCFLSDLLIDSTSESGLKRLNNVANRVIKNREINYRFLFEISDFDKEDIVSWWDRQPIGLDIPNHTGNCIFCIEKTVNQLSYLCHTQKQDMLEWKGLVESSKIPHKGRKVSEEAMYRSGSRKMSFSEVYEEAMEETEKYWFDKVGLEKRLSPCASGSCDLYSVDDIE